MRTKINKIISLLPLIIIILISFSLRFINLGYSDYQGDEIKAFFITDPGQGVGDFLLNQRKGPGQFIVTFLTEIINPNYSNEMISRFPFAFAGALSVYFFYKLIEKHFGKRVAFYSSFFFATNGFFVALSRIVQYQSFVILFMVLALYYLSISLEKEAFRIKGLFMGLLFWAFSILFHYDGIFIAPFAFYLMYLWFRRYVKKFDLKDENFRGVLQSLIVPAVLVLLFYIPFVVNISQNTLSYWSGRITGDVSGKISSSKYLFTVYQPIYVVHFYVMLFLAGIVYYISGFSKKIILPKLSLFARIKRIIPDFNYDFSKAFFLLLWFVLAFFFLEIVVYIPGTHIYAYLIPMTVILAWGIIFAEKILLFFKSIIHPYIISYFVLLILGVFIYLQSYAIFVENKQEYPWENEKFFIWEFNKPTPIFHLSMFGFPYYRNWEGISNAIMNSENNGYYSTNERSSIARYYVPLEKSTDEAGHFVYIVNPQSFTEDMQQEKAIYWSQRYHPVFTFSRNGEDLVQVYYMEKGTIEEIMQKGF